MPSCTRLKLVIGWALLSRAVTEFGVHTGNKRPRRAIARCGCISDALRKV